MPEAKISKLKSLRKESDKAKIILLSFFHLVRDLIPLCTRGKEGSDAETGRAFPCESWATRRRNRERTMKV
jgi:hypothetical protein